MPTERQQLSVLVRKLNEATNRVVGVLAQYPEVTVQHLGDSGEISYHARTAVKLVLHDRIALVEARNKIDQVLTECAKDGGF